MEIEKLEEDIYCSPVQFRIKPEEIEVSTFRHPILNDKRIGDVASRILHESQKRGKYIAVTEKWLIEQYGDAIETIRSGSYEFDSPLAEDLRGINPLQIMDVTLSKMEKAGLLAKVEGIPSLIWHLTPKALGEYLRN